MGHEWPLLPQTTRGKGTSKHKNTVQRNNCYYCVKDWNKFKGLEALYRRRWCLNWDPQNEEQLYICCMSTGYRTVPGRGLFKGQVGRERIWESGNNSPYLESIVQESKRGQGIKDYLVPINSVSDHEHMEVHSVRLTFLLSCSYFIILIHLSPQNTITLSFVLTHYGLNSRVANKEL